LPSDGYDRGVPQESIGDLVYNLKCPACGETIEVRADPVDLPGGPIPCPECGVASWNWGDAESSDDEPADDVHVAELIDDADMEKLEPSSGDPLGNSTVLGTAIEYRNKIVDGFVIGDDCPREPCASENFVKERALAVCALPAVALLLGLNALGLYGPTLFVVVFAVMYATIKAITPRINTVIDQTECPNCEGEQ